MPDHDDLIAELRLLADHLDVPAPADQRAAVRARLARKKPRWRIWVISALVALAGAVGAVAPARAAVVNAVGGLLRVAGIEVRTAPSSSVSLPAHPSPLPSVQTVGLEEARRKVQFPVLLPSTLGTPDSVTVADENRVLTLTYSGPVRLDEFDGTLSVLFLKQTPNAVWVELAGSSAALWLPEPHPVTYVDRNGVERTATAHLAGPTLIWQTGAVTYRLEGIKQPDEALAVARSLG
jgi:hypothetical protein